MASLMKSTASCGNASTLRRSFEVPFPDFFACFLSFLVKFCSIENVSELVSVGVLVLAVVQESQKDSLRALSLLDDVLEASSSAVIWRVIRRISLCRLWCSSSEELHLKGCQQTKACEASEN